MALKLACSINSIIVMWFISYIFQGKTKKMFVLNTMAFQMKPRRCVATKTAQNVEERVVQNLKASLARYQGATNVVVRKSRNEEKFVDLEDAKLHANFHELIQQSRMFSFVRQFVVLVNAFLLNITIFIQNILLFQNSCYNQVICFYLNQLLIYELSKVLL